MSKKIIAKSTLIVTACLIFLTGCYKVVTYTVPENTEVVGTVSFSKDLVPIFNDNCSISGCHNSGGLKPDLSADKLYNTLINGNYIDASAPENSGIYLWLTGKKSTIMPAGAANNPSNINNLVLAWIKQGAQNN